MKVMSHRLLAPFLATLLAASSLASAQPAGDCGIAAQNAFVRDTMNDIYFWYREMPEVDPAAYPSPDALLQALRYRPLDTTFSYVGMRAAEDAFYSDSQFIGFGLSMKLVGPDDLRVSQVYPDSPAAAAGLARGHQVLQVNGVDVAALLSAGTLDAAFGADETGVPGRVRHRDLDGVERDAEMTKALVTIPTVSLTRVYEVRGRKVGYVVFKNFVQPSVAALDAAFATLFAERVTDLVLDLRYNGGGLVAVAQHLAGLIGGGPTSGQTFAQFVHNDRNAHLNRTLRFPNPPNALALPRLLVITTGSSASASELVINALRAFIPVIVIGDTTYGKPVGQYGYNFCDRVLYPVAFTLRNADGDGDFFDGIGPECPAADDLQHAFGDPAEASLAEALQYSGTGTCTAAAAATARAQSLRRPPPDRQPHRGGWHQRIGAY
jgi:carboxyl-terminal processing protease